MAELLTKESLKSMHRFKVRQVAKKMGMDKDEAMKTEPADLIDWILENQNGGGEEESGTKAKSAKKGSAKSAKSSSAKSSGKTARGAKAKKVEEDVEVDDSADVESGDLGVIMDRMTRLEEKIDAIGEIADKNIAPLIGDVQELRADNYKLLELIAHLYRNLENEEIINPENAPDELCCDDKLEQLEKEVAGEGN